MNQYELFGTATCSWTSEMRDWLEWQGHDFVEYDVELDKAARARLIALTGGQCTVPVLVENGAITQIGWNGRGCVVKP